MTTKWWCIFFKVVYIFVQKKYAQPSSVYKKVSKIKFWETVTKLRTIGYFKKDKLFYTLAFNRSIKNIDPIKWNIGLENIDVK